MNSPDYYSTPYKGKDRAFGEFKCNNCGNMWTSANSWANTCQECTKCRENVEPHRQRKLEGKKGPNKDDEGRAHRQDLCQKCKMLGRNCRDH